MSKEQDLFQHYKYLYLNIFNQFNVSLLNKHIDFFKRKKNNNNFTLNLLTAVYIYIFLQIFISRMTQSWSTKTCFIQQLVPIFLIDWMGNIPRVLIWSPTSY